MHGNINVEVWAVMVGEIRLNKWANVSNTTEGKNVWGGSQAGLMVKEVLGHNFTACSMCCHIVRWSRGWSLTAASINITTGYFNQKRGHWQYELLNIAEIHNRHIKLWKCKRKKIVCNVFGSKKNSCNCLLYLSFPLIFTYVKSYFGLQVAPQLPIFALHLVFVVTEWLPEGPW